MFDVQGRVIEPTTVTATTTNNIGKKLKSFYFFFYECFSFFVCIKKNLLHGNMSIYFVFVLFVFFYSYFKSTLNAFKDICLRIRTKR